jgi:lipoprotein-releasing system permease protein
VATALSVATMLISFAILYGFQDAVSQKVFGFWGHIRIKGYENVKSSIAEDNFIDKDESLEAIAKQNKNVKSINAYATKSSILSSKTEFDGLLMKGVEKSFDTSKFIKFLTNGRWIQFSDSGFSKEIIISNTTAKLLKSNIGDKLIVYCFDATSEKTRAKNVTIVGTYKTDIEEYDKQFFLCDINLIRDLNFWDSTQIGGYELYVNNLDDLDSTKNQLHNEIPHQWQSNTIKEEYGNIFDWLGLLDKNKYIFLIVMGTVAIVNLITCLIILVLERIKMIGILKSMGASNNTIQSIFVKHTLLITFLGTIFGIILGLGLCYLQQQTGFIKLSNAEAYSISTVPVKILWWHVPAISLGTILVSTLILTIPAIIIKKIKPVQAVRFD